MRAWHGVPVACLCPTHLARELNEIRQVCAVTRGEWAFDAEWHYAKLRGHISRGQLLPGHLQARAERLAAERTHRTGEGVDAPTVPEWLQHCDHERLRPTDVREHNVARLRGKCEGCARRLDHAERYVTDPEGTNQAIAGP